MWLPQMTMIVNAATAMALCQAVDLWGRKPFLVVLSVIAIVGSIVISRAQSMSVALFGTFLVSLVTPAQPVVWTVASEIVPKRYRMSSQSGISMIYAIGAIVTLLGGSALNKNYHDGWRIYWYIIAGLFALSATVIFFSYKPHILPAQSLSFREKIRKLDLVGMALLAPSLTLFVMALTWSDNPFSWNNPHILAPFILGICGSIVFIFYETKFKKDGLFHHGLFQDRNPPIAMFCIGLEGLAFIGANSYAPMEVALLGFETDPIMISLRFAIVFCVATPMSVVTAAYCTKTRQLRLPLIVSFIFFCAFYGTSNPTL